MGTSAGTWAHESAPVDVRRAMVDDARAARRDQFETEALVHLDALFGLALELTRCGTEAEELVLDTVGSAFEQWEQYRLGTNIRGWLFTLLHHTFVRRTTVPSAGGTDGHGGDADVWHPGAASAVDAEGQFYDALPREAIVRGVASLPREYGAAVILSDLRGLRYAEVGEVLGVPEGIAKARLYRGRQLLQQALAGYGAALGLAVPRRAARG